MTFGGEDEAGAGVGFDTARGRDWPSVRQFNVFLANRMGALLDLVKRFELSDVRLVSLTVVETADCAIIRLVPSDPERALASRGRVEGEDNWYKVLTATAVVIGIVSTTRKW